MELKDDRSNAKECILAELDKVNQSAGYKYQVHLGIDYEEPHFTLYLNGIGTIPRGDIQAIKAKSKNGKSFLCSVFIASLFGCKDFAFESRDGAGNVLYFDTEQNPRNTAKLVRRVHSLLGWDAGKDNPAFKAYALRAEETSSRLKIIEEVIKEEKPMIIFIDGIADLIENFNDVEQSTDLINELMRISVTYDCAVTAVLHTNKAKDDNGMKGHLGTMLLQKSSDVFEVRKDGDRFTVTETDCRNEPIQDFAFVIDDHGIPHQAAPAEEVRELARIDKMKNILRDVFKDCAELSYTDLVNSYQIQAAISVASAKRAVSSAKGNGLIRAEINGKYSLL
jgi:KaiC/GvpD/RAD55 family RecA-like ATPase